MSTAYKSGPYLVLLDKEEYKPVENLIAAELVKTRIKTGFMGHDPKKQEPLQQPIAAEVHTL